VYDPTTDWYGDATAGSGNYPSASERRVTCWWTIAVVLVIMWMLELVSSYTMCGFIHILLVIAILVILIRVIGGRKHP
jgi:hypothetical protein